MDTGRFTLILTHGVHTVRADVAHAIRAAIDDGARIVDVDIDLFGGADSSRKTALVTAHVVALAEARDTRGVDSRRPALRALE